MLEQIVGLEKMSILQCQELAKKIGFDSATFDLCGPKGEIPCKWLDAYFGMFATQSDPDHFIMAAQLQFNDDVWCKNIMPAKSESKESKGLKEWEPTKKKP